MSQRISSSASDHLGRGYPRPQLRRDGWVSLNGPWDFAFDPSGTWRLPSHVQWDRAIRVPFAAEAPASGVGVTSFFRACWYRRSVAVPRLGEGERLLLHFGAVDYEATVWAGGLLVGHHDGGYTPFTIDITPCALGAETLEIVVRAEDDPHDLAKPRGKQDWQLEPHSIWYPRTTGIWQTVWIEIVPDDVDRDRRAGRRTWSAGRSALEARVAGARRDPLRLHVRLTVRRRTILADDTLRRGRRRSAPPHRAVRSGHRRLPQRAAVESRVADADRREHRAAGASGANCSTRSTSYTALALGRRPARPLRAQRPAVPAAAGARPGLLAGQRTDRARRCGAAARRRARQGDGLQRRAQAPEDRRPALSLLGRRLGLAGVGGDAERLPLHAATRSNASPASGPRRSTATTATRASSPGCRSTSRGACRTCRTVRPSATTCRRSIT